MSEFLIYLMIGVAVLFLYDKVSNYTSGEFRFTVKEQIIVGLLWPLAIILFLYHFVKQVFK